MDETHATLTELRQNMADLINRAAYGGERIVLVSHGEPKAAIVSIADLRQLETGGVEAGDASSQQFRRALAKARQFRAEHREWQAGENITPEDATETLSRLREERDEEILGLR